MRSLLLLSILLIFSSSSKTQTLKPGYYINKNDDTVYIQIRLPKNMFGETKDHELRKQVEVTDSINGAMLFEPTDIKGFGYIRKKDTLHFLSKPIQGGKLNFLEPVVVGSKVSIYKYTVTIPGMYSSSVQDFFTLERPGSPYMFISNYDRLDELQSVFRSLFRDKQNILTLIDTKFKARRHIQDDIREIIEAANN